MSPTPPFETLLAEHRDALCALVRAMRPDLPETTADAALLAIGARGLLEAYHRFDPQLGVRFWAFAYHHVRGAILDHQYEESIEGRPPRNESRLVHVGALTTVLGEELGASAVDRRRDPLRTTTEGWQRVFRPEEPSPELAFAEAELGARMLSEIEELPTRERVVVRGMYFEERCLDDLGAQLGGLSRSWVSRLHTRALHILRGRLDR